MDNYVQIILFKPYKPIFLQYETLIYLFFDIFRQLDY